MRLITTVILTIFLALNSNPARCAGADLLPSETTVLINHAMNAQAAAESTSLTPAAERTSLTRPLISRMKTTDLAEIEFFLKGEAHFLNLEPEESRDVFWEFRKRTDDIGRVAAQRLMINRINAFGMVDEVANKDIPSYRQRFGIRAYDRYGITFPVQQTAWRLVENDEGDAALDLIADEVRRHDKFDSPYAAYRLPGRFMAVAIEQGRGEEFQQLQRWVVKGLDASIRLRQESATESPQRRTEMPGAVFRSVFEDQGFDYYDWTAAFLRLRAEISLPPG